MTFAPAMRLATSATAALLLIACGAPAPAPERVQMVTAAAKAEKCKVLAPIVVDQRAGPDKSIAVILKAMTEVSKRGGNGLYIVSNTIDWEDGAKLTGEALQCQF